VSLKDSFPELYRITWVKDAFVANHLQFCNDFVHWELDFVRLVQDWDLESLSNFLDLLYLVSVKGHGEDLLWLAGVVWARWMGKPFIICFFIALWLESCGLLFLPYLGCIG
jgi:hypothetical protein